MARVPNVAGAPTDRSCHYAMLLSAITPMLADAGQPAHWVHNLDPFLVRFPAGWPVEGIRWYGMAYVAGFVVATVLLHLYYRKGRSPLNPDQQADLMTALIVGILVGGRLGYMLLYDLPAFLANPLIFFQVWKGGMASHGGFVGGCLGLLWFTRRQRLPLLHVSDIAVTLAPPGILFGRVANFINGELWGKPSDVPWAVIFPKTDAFGRVLAYTEPRHPSQLYEAALEGLALLVYTQWRFWKSSSIKSCPGKITGEFLIAYALVRMFGEIFREPDEGLSLIFGLNRGSFYSIFLLLVGVMLLVWLRRRPPSR